MKWRGLKLDALLKYKTRIIVISKVSTLLRARVKWHDRGMGCERGKRLAKMLTTGFNFTLSGDVGKESTVAFLFQIFAAQFHCRNLVSVRSLRRYWQVRCNDAAIKSHNLLLSTCYLSFTLYHFKCTKTSFENTVFLSDSPYGLEGFA